MNDSGGRALLDAVEGQGLCVGVGSQMEWREKHKSEEVNLGFGWVLGMNVDSSEENDWTPQGKDL